MKVIVQETTRKQLVGSRVQFCPLGARVSRQDIAFWDCLWSPAFLYCPNLRRNYASSTPTLETFSMPNDNFTQAGRPIHYSPHRAGVGGGGDCCTYCPHMDCTFCYMGDGGCDCNDCGECLGECGKCLGECCECLMMSLTICCAC